jgi:hypothetical protein
VVDTLDDVTAELAAAVMAEVAVVAPAPPAGYGGGRA